MAYTHEDLKQQLLDYVNTNPGWNWNQWNDETYWLGLHHKFDDQLTALQEMYKTKLKGIYQTYKEIFDILKYGVSESFIQATSEDDILDLKAVKQKVMRIARKLRGVNAEIEGRSRGFFGPGLTYDRVYVGTSYYIDLDAGDDAKDGLTTGNAWLTLAKYTSVTARSAGDIAYVRANTSETIAAVVNFDEDGTKDSRISIIGCDAVTNDPWGDASNVKPIIDHNAGAFYLYPSADEYWYVERLEIKNNTYSNGVVFQNASHWYWKDCDLKDDTGSYVMAINPDRTNLIYDGCSFSNAGIVDVSVKGGRAKFIDCSFDSGGNGTDEGVRVSSDGHAELIDCSFGQSSALNNYDVRAYSLGSAYLRNCNMNQGVSVYNGGVVYEEDKNQVKGANVSTFSMGSVTKDTGVTRVGGASSSAKMEPGSTCGLFIPLTLNHNYSEIKTPFRIWTAAALTTITVYIRSLGTWGTYPTASELYLEASYLNHATNATRTKVQSNDVLSHASNWVAFDVTFTPLQAGFVYLNVFLKKYEDAGDGCYVDIKPVVS